MIKLVLMFLVSFSVIGCDSAPAKKPAPARVPVGDGSGGGGNGYTPPFQACTGSDLKDTVTQQCAAPCPNNSPRSNGQCTGQCPGNVAYDASGRCPLTTNNNLCPAQQTVTNAFYGSGLPQDQQQNFNSQYTQTLGQTNQQVALPAGSAYQCQVWDQNCIQQTSNTGQSCVLLDSTGRCTNYAQNSTLLGSGSTSSGTTLPQMVTCSYPQPALNNNQNGIASCFPQGVNPMLGGTGYGYGGNMFQQNSFGMDPMNQGLYNNGQIFNPMNQQLNPMLMGQRYPQMAGTYSQLGMGMNQADPFYQQQLGLGQSPLVLSSNPAPYCQMYNQMMYRNMMMASGADPCMFAQNTITAFMCAGKGIIDTFRLARSPVRQERFSSGDVGVREADPLDDPVPSSQVTQVENTPTQVPSTPPTVEPTPLPVKPPPPVTAPPPVTPPPPVVTTTPKPAPAPKRTLGGQSRPCLIGGTPLAGETCANGGAARVILPVTPAGNNLSLTSNSRYSGNLNEADFAIGVQVVKDSATGVNKLKFFSNDTGVRISVKYVSGMAELIQTGPMIWAHVEWTVRGKTYCGIQEKFQVSIWSQSKPLAGVECRKGGNK